VQPRRPPGGLWQRFQSVGRRSLLALALPPNGAHPRRQATAQTVPNVLVCSLCVVKRSARLSTRANAFVNMWPHITAWVKAGYSAEEIARGILCRKPEAVANVGATICSQFAVKQFQPTEQG
jgi:hypothetical protein